MKWRGLFGLAGLVACAQAQELLPPLDAGQVIGADGGTDGGADAGLPPYGSACSGACAGGLTCFTSTDAGQQFPGGFCSTPCSVPTDCPFPQTTCATIGMTSVCLPSCNPSLDVYCRDGGYDCCQGGLSTGGTGACGITASEYCQ
jgi:hypothetical protein